MIQFGRHITQAGDPLQKITVERLFQGIHRPKQAFRDRIEQLRLMMSIDPTRYRELKKHLPYFVCGIFHPPIRRKEHFALIEYFILDLDHLAAFGHEVRDLSERFRENKHIVMCFMSPSSDGMKIMFRLKEKCTDESLFSSFYKVFATQFAAQYELQMVIDYKTSDVTRACFLSYDPQAWHCPEAQPIDMQEFLPQLDFGLSEKAIKKAEKEVRQQKKEVREEDPALTDEVLSRIKMKLNPGGRHRKKKEYFVPPQVEKALPELKAFLSKLEMTLADAQPIQYGQKLKVVAGTLWAEINIFFGKKGFSVVKTTKSGSNAQLADLAVTAIKDFLAELDLET